MNPRLLCQSFFALGIVVDLGGLLFPWFKQEIMPYGSRRLETSPGKGAKSNSKIIGDFVASVQVPHSWFTYFYVFSVASSAFWGYQIFERGAAFQFLAAHSSKDVSKAMSAEQALLLWFLMALQGLRRLYESIVFTKPSQAKMWIGLWVIGIAYYLFTGIGVWIEGIASLSTWQSSEVLLTAWPSAKSLFAICIFFGASVTQHVSHRHLASLKKYTLPNHPFFQFIICPHYTSECLIYLALAIGGAPSGQVFNKTIFSGFIFVVSNLSVTANLTRKWYIQKFGAENVESRSRIMPFIY